MGTSYDSRQQGKVYDNLAIEIISAAVKDLKKRNCVHQITANNFFESSWFEDLCLLINIDSNLILNKIKKEMLKKMLRKATLRYCIICNDYTRLDINKKMCEKCFKKLYDRRGYLQCEELIH